MLARQTGFAVLTLVATGFGCPERLGWRAGSTANLVEPVDSTCFRAAILRDSANRALTISPLSVTFVRLPDTLQAWSDNSSRGPFISVGRTWPRDPKPGKSRMRAVEASAHTVIRAIARECKTSQRGKIQNWDP